MTCTWSAGFKARAHGKGSAGGVQVEFTEFAQLVPQWEADKASWIHTEWGKNMFNVGHFTQCILFIYSTDGNLNTYYQRHEVQIS